MANSNTEHSKKLRSTTSAAWKKENEVKITIHLGKDYHDLVQEFEQIPGATKAEKLKTLITLFKTR